MTTDRLAQGVPRCRARFEEISSDFRVTVEPFDFDSGSESRTVKRFSVMDNFGLPRILQTACQATHSIGQRQNARFTRSVTHGKPVLVRSKRYGRALTQFSL